MKDHLCTTTLNVIQRVYENYGALLRYQISGIAVALIFKSIDCDPIAAFILGTQASLIIFGKGIAALKDDARQPSRAHRYIRAFPLAFWNLGSEIVKTLGLRTALILVGSFVLFPDLFKTIFQWAVGWSDIEASRLFLQYVQGLPEGFFWPLCIVVGYSVIFTLIAWCHLRKNLVIGNSDASRDAK